MFIFSIKIVYIYDCLIKLWFDNILLINQIAVILIYRMPILNAYIKQDINCKFPKLSPIKS